MIRLHTRKHTRKHTDRYESSVSPFDFKPSGAETGDVDISLPIGKSITINWGDGNKTKVSGPVNNQNYTNAYAGVGIFPVTFSGDFRSVTRLDINTVNCDSTISRLGELTGLTHISCTDANTISGDIANLPMGLIKFYCYGSNTIFGDIAELPTGLTNFYCIGSNTVSGDIANLPTGLTHLYSFGSNTISGDIANLPTGLNSFRCDGSNTISGDIANLPTGLTTLRCLGSNTIIGDIAELPTGLIYFYCDGNSTISDYSGKTWTTRPATFMLVPVGVGGLSTAEIDQLLIDFDDDLVWSGGTITLTGTNAARSAASNAAVTSLESEGVTVTTIA